MNRRIESGRGRQQRGFSLIDVVIAMAVFAIGLLAYMQLQLEMSRAGLDAQLRTVASNLAEATIESQRRFARLETDPDGETSAYHDIADGDTTTTVGGVDFTISQAVTDYYWKRATSQFSTVAPDAVAHSDFKHLSVTVSWQNPLEYFIDGTRSTQGHLGSGSVTFTTIVSSAVSATSRLALIDDLSGGSFQPPIPDSVPDLPGLPFP